MCVCEKNGTGRDETDCQGRTACHTDKILLAMSSPRPNFSLALTLSLSLSLLLLWALWLCRSCFCSCSLTPPLYSKLLTAALLVTCTQSLLPPRLPRAVLVQVQRGQLGTCIQCPAAPTIHNLFDWTSLSCSHQQHQPTHTCTLTSTHSAGD
ncbi:Protein of unknown function [Cotesia congregata]|uniref:Uncharacterized protein n=1 Tax=Cotesia congregata TaxID=51543 RepID=A0A8J2HSD4_COTCN|nr:Protein of unknown function [Cotesia congregata]